VEHFDQVERDFDSLTDCLRFARAENQSGRYLYRGERTDRYNTTWPMAHRIAHDLRLPPRVRSDLPQIVGRLHVDLQSFLGLDEALALGFIQHYEAPTDLLDLTDSADVAGCFGCGNEAEGYGLIALVPRSIAALGALIDLTDHPKANRPRRQRGHVLRTETAFDLKSTAARDIHGVRWLRFRHRDSEYAARNERLKSLLDAHDDEVAGVLQLLLDSYGKWNDWTAQWLADHIAAAPFLTRMAGSGIVELVRLSEAGAMFDETVERFNNHRIWSNQFSDQRGHGGLANLRFASDLA
jgi:hypothetical protein